MTPRIGDTRALGRASRATVPARGAESHCAAGNAKTRIRAGVISLLTTGFALCGQAIGADVRPLDAKAAQIDACALLSSAEISQAIGLPVDNGSRKDAGFQSNGSYSSACVWVIQPDKTMKHDPSAPLGGRSFVILNAVQWPAGRGLARTYLQAFHDAAANGEIPSKPTARQFGDEALWWGDGLAVRKRDVSFGVSVFIPGSKSKRPIFEEQLAPHILRRLDQRDAGVRRLANDNSKPASSLQYFPSDAETI